MGGFGKSPDSILLIVELSQNMTSGGRVAIFAAVDFHWNTGTGAENFGFMLK